MKDKLNLGCGADIRKEYLNVDYFDSKGVDKVLDLEKFPYPFEENSFKEIVMQDILEHLNDPIKTLEEIFRISKHNAKIKIRVPHFSSGNVWGDLTHKRGFSSTIFNHFDLEKNKHSTSLEKKRKMNFKIKKVRLHFPAPYRFIGFNQIFSIYPLLYERMFYGIFPCGNISFEIEADKK